MKYILIGIGILLPTLAFGLGSKGYRMDGTYDETLKTKSRIVKTTYARLERKMGRITGYTIRSKNYIQKETTAQKRKQTPQQRSAIYQRDKARYRGSLKPSLRRDYDKKVYVNKPKSKWAMEAVYWRNRLAKLKK